MSKKGLAERVLIIEGVPSQSKNLALYLMRAGYDVARLPSHPEALVSMYVLSPDIIIVDDLNIEHRDGYRRIGNAMGVPVISISGMHCAYPGRAS